MILLPKKQMTQTDITRTLHVDEKTVHKAVVTTISKFPRLQKYIVNGKLFCNTQFNLEETIEIYKQLGRNDLEIIVLKENWKEVPETDVITIKGTLEFIKRFNADPTIKCCNTCKYLKGKALNSKMPKPYCSLYKMLLESMNAKVYEDWCSSYSYIKFTKPRQWFNERAPHNLNVFGDTNTVNGIDKSQFKTERSVKDTVVLVNEVGF